MSGSSDNPEASVFLAVSVNLPHFVLIIAKAVLQNTSECITMLFKEKCHSFRKIRKKTAYIFNGSLMIKIIEIFYCYKKYKNRFLDMPSPHYLLLVPTFSASRFHKLKFQLIFSSLPFRVFKKIVHPFSPEH